MNWLRLTKKQLSELFERRCRHGHRYAAHLNCWKTEQKLKERIGFLDLEFYGLNADWGIMLCWVIADEQGRMKWDVITKKDFETNLDKRIVKSCIIEMGKYDMLIGHYSSKCDFPYVLSRALHHHLDYIPYNTVKQGDVWIMSRTKLRLSSNRQRVLSNLLRGKSNKTEVRPETWLAALRGDKRALEYILRHCKIDVKELRLNYLQLAPYCPKGGRSI